jgi:endonuclease/exonuclease/phosphatase family metal-dependent hydrolase
LDQGRDIANRIVQADFLNQVLARAERPGILAGDLNSRPDTEVMQILGLHWTNASPVDPPRDPTARPYGRVDYVLVRPTGSWRAIESTVVDAPVASDHRPLLSVLEWDPKP